MKKSIVLFFLLLNSAMYSCSLCALSAPRTDVGINIEANKQKIKSAKITWTFEKAFSEQLMQLYDLNLNNVLDKKELDFIEKSLLTYIEPREFLTFISYSKTIPKKSNKIDVKTYKLYYKNKQISFTYDVDLDYDIVNNNTLYIKIHDKEAYFSMLFDNRKQKFNIPYKYKKIIKPTNIKYTISKQ